MENHPGSFKHDDVRLSNASDKTCEYNRENYTGRENLYNRKDRLNTRINIILLRSGIDTPIVPKINIDINTTILYLSVVPLCSSFFCHMCIHTKQTSGVKPSSR
jgi:hypothetical protein